MASKSMKTIQPAAVQLKYLAQDDQAKAAITAFIEGNRRAFDRLVHLYSTQVFSLCRGMLGNESEAEDAAQEIFLIVYRSLNRFRPEQRFHPWLYTITINYLRTTLRKRKHHNGVQILRFTPVRGPDDYPSALPGPEELALNRESEDILETALAALKPIQRAVFLLRRIESLSISETATILGISEGSVKTHLHRTLNIMRQKLFATPQSKKLDFLKPNPNPNVDTSEGRK